MMKLAVTALSLFLVLSPSQAKTSESAQDQVSRNHSELKTQMRTKSVRVLAVKKTQRKLVIDKDMEDGDNGPPGSDELDLHIGYDRPRLVKNVIDDEPLSELALVRLAVARARAMELYREKWA